MDYKLKYLKYKNKYLNLKGGTKNNNIFIFDIDDCLYLNNDFRSQLGFGLVRNIYLLYTQNQNAKINIDNYINSNNIKFNNDYKAPINLQIPDNNVELFSKLNNLEFNLYRKHGTSYVGLLKECNITKEMLDGITHNETKGFYNILFSFLSEIKAYDMINSNENLAELINKIKKSYPVFYFTNGDMQHAKKILNNLGITFEESDIYSIDNLNNVSRNEDYYSKPSEEYYNRLRVRLCELLKEKIGCDFQIIFFEDTVNNLVTGKKLNWKTVLIRENYSGFFDKNFNYYFETLDEMINIFMKNININMI